MMQHCLALCCALPIAAALAATVLLLLPPPLPPSPTTMLHPPLPLFDCLALPQARGPEPRPTLCKRGGGQGPPRMAAAGCVADGSLHLARTMCTAAAWRLLDLAAANEQAAGAAVGGAAGSYRCCRACGEHCGGMAGRQRGWVPGACGHYWLLAAC